MDRTQADEKRRIPVIGYYRPFPWNRIGTNRTGRTGVERELRSQCQSNGLRLVGFFVESDTRSNLSLEDRTVGREVMQRLRSGIADEVLVARPEHVFFSTGNAVASIERWLDEGIGFRCADFFNGSPLHVAPGAPLLESECLIHGLAVLQRSIDYEQTRARILSRKSKNTWTGRPPFGFTLQNRILVEDEDRIHRIQRMKSLYRRGKSYRQIALEFGISVGMAHRLVKTDLRKLRRIGKESDAPAANTNHGTPSGES